MNVISFHGCKRKGKFLHCVEKLSFIFINIDVHVIILLNHYFRTTCLLNEHLCIQNVQAKRGFNLCLWMYGNAEKLIFEILPRSIFYYSQYRQYIWADLVALALLFGLPSKILCGRISKMSFLHYPNIHKHGLMPLLSCTFCICQAPFSRRVVWMYTEGCMISSKAKINIFFTPQAHI